MRVFMLGWEFPPFISGGLGTACYGLTKALSGIGTDIIFVLPRPISTPFSTHVQLVAPHPDSPYASPVAEMRLDEFENVTFRTIESQLKSPYQAISSQYEQPMRATYLASSAASDGTSLQAITDTTNAHQAAAEQAIQAAYTATPGYINTGDPGAQYGGDLFAEVQRYSALALEIAQNETFEVVHAHDWMTFPAGIAVAAAKNVPLVVHVHSTEFDRSGINVDQRIYDIERQGMHAAMKVVAVSSLTRNVITQHYGIPVEKVEVVYNAIDINGNGFEQEKYDIQKNEKIVLFLGRITMQKGPEYFIAAAKKVLEVMDNVKFVMAGSGDMIRRTIELAASMGIGHKVLFTGFLRGADVEKVFKMADLYVMPSVSEPFGIAPLEAMSHDVPVIISKQSGVSELLQHALKVDFWDVNEMANKIVSVLRRPALANELRQQASFEVRRRTWTDAAKTVVTVYKDAIDNVLRKKTTEKATTTV